MIGRVQPALMSPEVRAQLIYAQARGELSNQLWQAALGTGYAAVTPAGGAGRAVQGVSLDALMAMLMADEEDGTGRIGTPRAGKAPSGAAPAVARADPAPAMAGAAMQAAGKQIEGLGANAGLHDILSTAAARTGMPAAALAAIVDAEAAKDGDGRWLAFSRNARSSAAGLGQFLTGTWKSEAQRAGTWLNGVASARGWLDARGHLRSDAKSELLAMRYDPRASIEAIADYARGNLDRLNAAGIRVRPDVDGIAQAAYLGHHLGIGDAIKFLNGNISPEHARRLLDAQIGAGAANRRIAASGTATGAHRAWLMEFVAHNVRPARFAAARDTGSQPGGVQII
jgi:hypothetical protein